MRYLLRILLLSVIIGCAKAHSFIKLVILAGLGLAGLYMVHTLAMDFNNIVQSGFGGSAGSGLPVLQAAGGSLSTIIRNTFGRNNNNNDEELLEDSNFGNSFGNGNGGPKLFDGHGKLYNEQELKNVYKRSEIEAKTGKTLHKRSLLQADKSVFLADKSTRQAVKAPLQSDKSPRQADKSVPVADKPRGINWQLVLSRDPASCARSFICQLAATKEQDLEKEEKIILMLTKSSTKDSTWASKQIREALKHGHSVTYPYQCMKEYKFCPYTKNMMMGLLKFFSGSK